MRSGDHFYYEEGGGMEPEKKFVWIDLKNRLHEFDPKTGEGPVIVEKCNDMTLIASSEAVEDEPAQGVVCAYFGVDRHWHFDHYLTTAERLSLGLYADRSEREAHQAKVKL